MSNLFFFLSDMSVHSVNEVIFFHANCWGARDIRAKSMPAHFSLVISVSLLFFPLRARDFVRRKPQHIYKKRGGTACDGSEQCPPAGAERGRDDSHTGAVSRSHIIYMAITFYTLPKGRLFQECHNHRPRSTYFQSARHWSVRITVSKSDELPLQVKKKKKLFCHKHEVEPLGRKGNLSSLSGKTDRFQIFAEGTVTAAPASAPSNVTQMLRCVVMKSPVTHRQVPIRSPIRIPVAV